MLRFTPFLFTFLSFCSFCCAAPIQWETAVNTVDMSQLLEGTVVYAFSGGTGATVSNGGASGVNSYTFTAGNYTDLSFSPTPGNGTFIVDSPNTGDRGFDSVLKSFAFASGISSGTQIVNGLDDKQSYQIQVFFNDPRSIGRSMTLGDGEASPSNATITANQSAGQYVIGSFTADGATQLLTHAANGFGSIHCTAILITAPGPVPVLTTALTEVTTPTFTVTINFSESVTGLEESDFSVTNGTVTPSSLSGSVDSCSLQVTSSAEGEVSIVLPSNSVNASGGDQSANLSYSNRLKVQYTLPSTPTVALYSILASAENAYQVYLTFSEPVAGLDTSDFLVVNGAATNVSGSDRHYTVTIQPASPGSVEVSLPAGSVTDLDGDLLANSGSETVTTTCTTDFGEQWIVDDAASWGAATGSSNNMTIADGSVEPTANTADFSSVIKTFTVKKKATKIVFQQSPVWENWTASTSDLGPSGASDAPVFVPAGKDDYFYLGKGATNGYHAWHSTDMVNWVHKGPVTPPISGRWVTSAEYKDGFFYIYSDYFNDHTPHLFKDADLGDGVVGEYLGAAFPREGGHGSDCSLIRNDEDGLFHLIYEDWSPIKASSHSWDSPLAGHTSSLDGLTGFEPHEHVPAVDHRTTPTGTFGTYNHPNARQSIFEIHTPEQNAYGDWTTVKIGSRFFMFGDFHPAGQDIILARFASDSIYEEFEMTGSMHQGHPDPSVGFAEGQFYLFTQQATDYTSPGPWVDGVQARAGVDIDGDGGIDQWTVWQSISEQYDYTPEFIRVVALTPAQLDLSELPAGYGFQYEFKVDNTVVSEISPIMDRIEMNFEPSHFQAWSNTNGVPFAPNADINGNSIPNLIEFSLGSETLPQMDFSSNELTIPLKNEALKDNYAMSLWFSENLRDWEKATSVTVPLRLQSESVKENGDTNQIFGFDSNGAVEHIYWYLEITDTE